MSKHTQGPWRFEFEDGYCGEIIASNGKVLCAFVEEPSEEDARLMTAAPELLDALKAIEEFHSTSGTQSDDKGLRAVHAMARAAIAKAEGGTQ